MIGFVCRNYSWNEIWYVPELENNNVSLAVSDIASMIITISLLWHFGRTQKYETKMVFSALLLLFHCKSWLLSLSFFLKTVNVYIVKCGKYPIKCEKEHFHYFCDTVASSTFLRHLWTNHWKSQDYIKFVGNLCSRGRICFMGIPTFLFLNCGLKEDFHFVLAGLLQVLS